MQFSSLIFVTAFLPIFLIFYKIASSSKKISVQNAVFLCFTLLFCCFGGLRSVVVLLVVTLIGYIGGLVAESAAESGGERRVCGVTVIILAAILAWFKYAGFIIDGVVMPAGISFYTFKMISYVADVTRGKYEAERNPACFLIYSASFHTVMQGPIVRYDETRKQIYDRKLTATGFAEGFYRFVIGLAKKVILADHAGEMAGNLLPKSVAVADMPTVGIWLGMICFTLQMYLDFSAYCDMAIGLGRMLGFTYPENFDYPYMARSVKEFWRKWHITLSSFFKDYVYIPLGGNRLGKQRRTINLLCVWLLTGIWHGATLNFIIWGLFYFAFICLENMLQDKGYSNCPRIIGHIYTIIIFNVGWLIFRFEKFGQLRRALAGMVGLGKGGWNNHIVKVTFSNNVFFLIVAVIACTPLMPKLRKLVERTLRDQRKPLSAIYLCKLVITVILFFLSLCVMTGSTYQPFLYNAF